MPALRRSDDCLSDLVFDAWLSDAIEPARRSELESHLEQCARCALRCEVINNQRAAFLERVPSWDALETSVANQGRPGLATKGGGATRSRWLWGTGFVALAASVLLAIVRPRPEPLAVRSKGGPHIGAYIKRGERVVRVESGDSAQAGDYVRFTYSSEVPTYFALLNHDARAAATYYPLETQTARVNAGHDVALDFSIKLDGAPGIESVHGIFCDQPQQLEPLRAQLAATGQLPALAHCKVDVFILTKKARE